MVLAEFVDIINYYLLRLLVLLVVVDQPVHHFAYHIAWTDIQLQLPVLSTRQRKILWTLTAGNGRGNDVCDSDIKVGVKTTDSVTFDWHRHCWAPLATCWCVHYLPTTIGNCLLLCGERQGNNGLYIVLPWLLTTEYWRSVSTHTHLELVQCWWHVTKHHSLVVLNSTISRLIATTTEWRNITRLWTRWTLHWLTITVSQTL